jgi:TIR domain
MPQAHLALFGVCQKSRGKLAAGSTFAIDPFLRTYFNYPAMALEVFYSYAHEDELFRVELEKQLSLLQRNGFITGWHDRQIGAGQNWREEIDTHIRSAHIILLLVSPDFIASDYCYGTEMRIALERQRNHEAIVIPVLLRPIDWRTAPFSHLQALPANAVAVSKWDNLDQAIADVARGIREAVSRFHAPEIKPDTPAVALVDQYVPQPRVVDAAIPAHIVKGRGTRLLVLIRLPDSAGLFGVLQEEQDDEARPEDVRSRPFKMTFPIGPIGKAEPLKVTVKVTSPDFSPPEQAKNIFVPPDGDSDVCQFMLTPLGVGRLTLLVELQWEDAVRGQRTLLTKCVSEAADVPSQREMNLVQMHILSGGSEAEVVGGRLRPAPAATAVLEPPAAAPSRDLAPAPVEGATPRSDPLPPSVSIPKPNISAPTPAPPVPPPSVGCYERATAAPPLPPPASAPRASSGSRWFKSPLVMAMLGFIPVVFLGYHFLWSSSKPVEVANSEPSPRTANGVHAQSMESGSAPLTTAPGTVGAAPGLSHPRTSKRPSHPADNLGGSDGPSQAGSPNVEATLPPRVPINPPRTDPPLRQAGPPQRQTISPGAIAFSGQVYNARTNFPVYHARVIVFLDGRPSTEQYTDFQGRFFFNLGQVPVGTGGLVYSSAPNFVTLKRNFAVTQSSISYDLPLQPLVSPQTRR